MIHESDEEEVESPLRTLRGVLGLTQEQFAALVGVSVRTVTRWENGLSDPSFNVKQWKILMAEMAKANLTVENLPDKLTPGNRLIIPNGG